MDEIDGGEILVRGIEAERVRVIFAIADVSYTPVFRSAEQHGIRIVGGRHESANVHMAEGWARATGGVALAMGAMGPGVANLVPGVINAWIEGLPLLVVATQRTQRAHRSIRRGRFQYTPQIEVFQPVTKFAGAVPDARRISEYLREAFRCALSGRPGPVYLEIADEIFRQKVDEARVPAADPTRYRAAPGAPDPAGVERAATLLAEASLPLLLAGCGVLRAGAWPELRALAERSAALVVTTNGARGVLPEDHPQLVLLASPGGARALSEADVVLAVGTQVGEMLGYGRPPRWGSPERQRWIQLDVDPASIGVNRDVDVPLVGDARAGLAALGQALAARGVNREPSVEAREMVEVCRKAGAALVESLAKSAATPIHPARLAHEVASFFPPDAIVCFDGGNTTIWAHLFHRFHEPRGLLWTSHFGHLGSGLSYAIAAKLARPDRPVYLFTGDSAFGFNLQELETAVRERAEIVVVICCDFAWGMERLGQQIEMGKTLGVDTAHVRYDEVARGMGCHGERVEDPGEIRPALARASAAGRPAVVQVLIDPKENVNPPGLLEFARMYRAAEDS
ncbi:MAG: thiamine pyrophosphate-binding protein [Myxococcota bacterium]